jgi:hypothetical protein
MISYSQNISQLSLDDVPSGVDRAYQNANGDWKTTALQVVYAIAMQCPNLSADDVVSMLSSMNVTTHNLSALAGVFKTCKKLGYIKESVCMCCNGPRMVESTRKTSNKRRIMLYDSLIFSPHS